ncbi:hypothetical protein HHI36_016133 [Cryptolaemus montrouzieri]|uniref:TATA-binding protein interacting (TIP20) domain-containing protein n=1 Tax=Cryptolaemus montrouzieri TaxID=559131 RepID=A0ABD2NIT3_9CUCU
MYVNLLKHIIVELSPLLDEVDLHIAQWTLVILKSIAEYHPAALKDMNVLILPQILVLVKSPLLQGSALNALLNFFKAVVKCNLPKLTYSHLLQIFLQLINSIGTGQCTIHKQVFYSLAKCVAAIDIRKAAFDCMYTILDFCLDRIDIFDFIAHVEGGLKDHYDIKMLTYLMVARLSQICPGAVLQRLDRLVEPLRATCTMKVKANSVKQEYEKQDELSGLPFEQFTRC